MVGEGFPADFDMRGDGSQGYDFRACKDRAAPIRCDEIRNRRVMARIQYAKITGEMPTNSADRINVGDKTTDWFNNDIKQHTPYPKGLAGGDYEDNKKNFWTYTRHESDDNQQYQLLRKESTGDNDLSHWSQNTEEQGWNEYGLFVFGTHTGRYSNDVHGARRELIRLE